MFGQIFKRNLSVFEDKGKVIKQVLQLNKYIFSKNIFFCCTFFAYSVNPFLQNVLNFSKYFILSSIRKFFVSALVEISPADPKKQEVTNEKAIHPENRIISYAPACESADGSWKGRGYCEMGECVKYLYMSPLIMGRTNTTS